eukprot:GHVS01096354.1.p1 GENE.GHVS01096354.1~~GHVS01096354.1.p1  ORF type:complete len:130 (+),score=5.19 GHVS01096354.1:136-525(+)
MYMHNCTPVYMYVYTLIHTLVYTLVYPLVHIHLFISTCKYPLVHIHLYISTCTYPLVSTCIHLCPLVTALTFYTCASICTADSLSLPFSSSSSSSPVRPSCYAGAPLSACLHLCQFVRLLYVRLFVLYV